MQEYNRADIILGEYMRTIDNLNKDWFFKKNTEVTKTTVADDTWDIINITHTYNGFDGQ